MLLSPELANDAPRLSDAPRSYSTLPAELSNEHVPSILHVDAPLLPLELSRKQYESASASCEAPCTDMATFSSETAAEDAKMPFALSDAPEVCTVIVCPKGVSDRALKAPDVLTAAADPATASTETGQSTKLMEASAFLFSKAYALEETLDCSTETLPPANDTAALPVPP